MIPQTQETQKSDVVLIRAENEKKSISSELVDEITNFRPSTSNMDNLQSKKLSLNLFFLIFSRRRRRIPKISKRRQVPSQANPRDGKNARERHSKGQIFQHERISRHNTKGRKPKKTQ